jgi:peptidoglycan/LPS O-acetylase OafA/YrhL
MGTFRVILAFAVVLGHTAYSGPRLMSPSDAVHIFFVISGFYMCMVLRRKYGWSGRGVRAFYLNRFLRLYPTYIAVVLGAMAWYFFCRWSTGGTGKPAAIMELAGWLPNWGWWALWVPNFTLVGVDLPAWFNVWADGGVALAGSADAPVKGDGAYWLGYGLWVGPAWTIGCEIWFYALAPFLLAGRPVVRMLAAAGISLGLLWWIGGKFLDGGYFIWVFWLWLFVNGMLCYLAYEKWEGHLRGIFRRFQWGVPLFLLAAFGFFTVPYLLGYKISAWLSIPVAVVCIPLLFEATKSNALDRLIGEFSYPVYCTHMLAAEVNQTLIGVLNMDWSWLVWMNIGTTLAASAVCVFLIEQPFERIRARIASRVARG